MAKTVCFVYPYLLRYLSITRTNQVYLSEVSVERLLDIAMQFGISFQNYNISIKLENCSVKIVGGNWGIFTESFSRHMHSYYELHYVSGGQGTLITDTFEMPLYKGCFYLLPPRTNHEQWTNHSNCLEEYHLAFELTYGSDNDLIWKSLFLNGFYDAKKENLEELFENIGKESNQKQYGYLDAIHNSIQSIFIVLIRSIVNTYKNISAPSANLDDKRSMLIDEAFLYKYKTITLISLSDQLKLSTRQTQRFIMKKYGVPFSILKNQSRLSHAAMLLTTTKLSLDEICFQVGYRNCSFFSRSFKQCYNMTPVYYRKSHNLE
jgi:AraC-like DNA-binding protein